jgi:hypothetical protein
MFSGTTDQTKPIIQMRPSPNRQTLELQLRPARLSLFRGKTFLNDADGRPLATLTVDNVGARRVLGLAAGLVATAMATRTSAFTLEHQSNELAKQPSARTFVRQFLAVVSNSSPWVTAGFGAVVGIAIGVLKPRFCFEGVDHTKLLARWRRSRQAFDIRHGARQFWLRAMTPAESPEPHWVLLRDGDANPELEIPARWRRGTTFGTPDRRFRFTVESLARWALPLVSGRLVLPIPGGASESYSVVYSGGSAQAEMALPRDVLVFASYIVRQMNVLPFGVVVVLTSLLSLAGAKPLHNIMSMLTSKYESLNDALTRRPKVIDEIMTSTQNIPVVSISVCRKPIKKIGQMLLRLATFNKIQTDMRKLRYDQLYHLYTVFTLQGGQKVMIEKGARVRIRTSPITAESSCTYEIKMSDDRDIKSYIETLESFNIPEIYVYRAFSLNCQHFTQALLNANGISEFDSFILQNLDSLVPSFVKSIADVGSRVEATVGIIRTGELNLPSTIVPPNTLAIEKTKNKNGLDSVSIRP